MVNLKELIMILELHRQGLSVSAIAERTGHDRKTVRKYIADGLVVPKYKSRAPQAQVVCWGIEVGCDPFWPAFLPTPGSISDPPTRRTYLE